MDVVDCVCVDNIYIDIFLHYANTDQSSEPQLSSLLLFSFYIFRNSFTTASVSVCFSINKTELKFIQGQKIVKINK